jgi:uncharacterized protein
MKVIILMLMLLMFNSLNSQNQNPLYNAALADSLGADDYGMKWYVLVILRTGTGNVQNPEERQKLFAGHFENMRNLSEQGKLVLAGPFGQNSNAFRGLFILNTQSEEEARELLQSDPTIREGIFSAELYPWYGSAALFKYLETHKKIEKTQVQ